MSAASGQAAVLAPSLFAFGERRGLGKGASASAVAPAVAVALARDFVLAFAFRLLTSPAVERAEHRSGTGGEEAHVFERSELCAVPPSREERRGPMRRSRIGSRPAVLSFGYLFFARAKKSNSLPEGERKPLLLPLLLPLSTEPNAEAKSKAGARAFAPASHERATFLCSCKEKVAKRKHALPPRPRRYAPRVHSAAGIFRHDIPVVSKNDVHPCTSPLRGLVRRLRRYGRGPERQKPRATTKAIAPAPLPNPSLSPPAKKERVKTTLPNVGVQA